MSAVTPPVARAATRRSSGRVRSRVQTQWLALGAALVVLAGVLVAWGLSQATERVQVVQVARDVEAGHVLVAADLTVTGVAYDGAVQGLVPASSLQALIGRVAAIDLSSGSLVQVGMWSDEPALAAGEQRVGAVLKPGRFPAGLTRGDLALAAAISEPLDTTVAQPADGSAGTDDTVPAPQSVPVRVLDARVTDDGGLSLTLAVSAEQAVAVAQLAATDQLLLVGRGEAVGS